MATATNASSYRKDVLPLTPSEVSTALRPFFFAVHPDRFSSTPIEQKVNENSLKLLNEYLELKKQSLSQSLDSDQSRDVDFYLKDNRSEGKKSQKLILVKINLLRDEDMNETVDRILSSCKLSTDYLSRIGKKPERSRLSQSAGSSQSEFKYRGRQEAFWIRKNVEEFRESYQRASWMNVDDVEEIVRQEPDETLIDFLSKNVSDARQKSDSSQGSRQDVIKLKFDIKSRFGIKDIIWNSDWNSVHARAALSSLQKLLIQHESSEFLDHLKEKSAIFGTKTGVNFDGSILLSTEDVRQNWLKLFNNIQSFDKLVHSVPFYECYLSSTLFGIKISHRKFNSIILIQSYLDQLIKLSTSVTSYHRRRRGQAIHEEKDFSKYKLVVESESGPLMLSPTGQFIAPSSCPASILIDFLDSNLIKADSLIKSYHENKRMEDLFISRTIATFNLISLEKDDNVTPDLMNTCISNLLNNQHKLTSLLHKTRLRISKYYSVQESGEICIPWNFML